MSIAVILLIAGSALFLGLLSYWQLIVVEGTYLGPRIVTLTYDVAASRYDGIKKFDPHFEATFLGRPLVHALSDVPAPYVLDVGIGTARLPLALFEQPTFNGRVVGLDSSRRMLQIAAEKVAPFKHRIDLLWLDAAPLPFPDAIFDAVTCMEVLEFTPDPVAQLAELVRVLRPGGVLLTTRRRGFDALLMPGKAFSEARFQEMVEAQDVRDVSIHPWQVDYDLVWAMRDGDPGAGMGGLRPLVEVLRCPACGEGPFVQAGASLRCEHCGTRFETVGGVVELRRAI